MWSIDYNHIGDNTVIVQYDDYDCIIFASGENLETAISKLDNNMLQWALKSS
jgi:hypothetical protein